MNRTQISLDQAVGKVITAYAMSKDEDSLLLAIGESEFVYIDADSDDYPANIDTTWEVDPDSFVLTELSKVFDVSTIRRMLQDCLERDLQRRYAASEARSRAESAARQPPVDRTCKGKSRLEAWRQEHGLSKRNVSDDSAT